ncbi:MAG: hypothetical protein M5U26_16140 [Planctomycetota bacterium]|nr:hypothetical protein [Planctomycetota bacterium]
MFEAAGEEDRAVECFKHGVGLEAAFPEKEELRYRLLARGLAGPSPEADDKWGFARLGHLVAKGRRGEADPGIIPLKRWNGTYSVDGRDREDLWRDEAFPWRELAHRVNGESPSKTPNEVKVAYDAGGVILFARGPALEWLMPGDLAGENRPVWQYNCFELFVTPNLKLTDYFELNLSASGGRYDGHQEWYFMGHEEWDGKWKSAVHSDGKTLFVEYYVPWADLELEAPPAPGTLWIANVIRVQFLPGADGKLVQGEFSWGPLKQRAFHRLQDGVVWKFE